MRLRLLKAARINHNAGDIVEVSPAQANFLLSVGAAEIVRMEVREVPEVPEKPKTTRKATKK